MEFKPRKTTKFTEKEISFAVTGAGVGEGKCAKGHTRNRVPGAVLGVTPNVGPVLTTAAGHTGNSEQIFQGPIPRTSWGCGKRRQLARGRARSSTVARGHTGPARRPPTSPVRPRARVHLPAEETPGGGSRWSGSGYRDLGPEPAGSLPRPGAVPQVPASHARLCGPDHAPQTPARPRSGHRPLMPRGWISPQSRASVWKVARTSRTPPRGHVGGMWPRSRPVPGPSELASGHGRWRGPFRTSSRSPQLRPDPARTITRELRAPQGTIPAARSQSPRLCLKRGRSSPGAENAQVP